MRILLILFSFFAFTSATELSEFVNQSGYETNYVQALEKAKNENKNLMFVVVEKNCPWCVKLEEQTLSDDLIDKEIKKEYVPLIMEKSSDAYPKDFYAPYVPYTFFVDSITEDTFYESIGFKNSDLFLEELKEASL